MSQENETFARKIGKQRVITVARFRSEPAAATRYSRFHKGGSFIGSRRGRVATKAIDAAKKFGPAIVPVLKCPYAFAYEYDYDDDCSVGRFVPPRRSVLPRNGVGSARIRVPARKSNPADAFPLHRVLIASFLALQAGCRATKQWGILYRLMNNCRCKNRVT